MGIIKDLIMIGVVGSIGAYAGYRVGLNSCQQSAAPGTAVSAPHQPGPNAFPYNTNADEQLSRMQLRDSLFLGPRNTNIDYIEAGEVSGYLLTTDGKPGVLARVPSLGNSRIVYVPLEQRLETAVRVPIVSERARQPQGFPSGAGSGSAGGFGSSGSGGAASPGASPSQVPGIAGYLWSRAKETVGGLLK